MRMKHALILIAACAMAYAQTKSTAAPKSATPAKAKAKAAPAVDIMKPDTLTASASPRFSSLAWKRPKGNIDIRVVHRLEAQTGVRSLLQFGAGCELLRQPTSFSVCWICPMAQVEIKTRKPAVNQV